MMSHSAMFKQIDREKTAWYIKWVASCFLICGMAVRASGVPSMAIYDLLFSLVGVSGWLMVSLIWKDRALIILNTIGFVMLASGAIKYFASQLGGGV